MKKPGIFFLVFLVCISAMGQWSVNPTINTFVAGTQGDRIFQKIAMTPQWTYYISGWKCISDPDTNFNFWLQHVDQNGYPLWGPDGIQISNQPCRTWLSDYTLASDAEGNAVIAFEDMRGGTGFSRVVAYKTASDGHALWDTNGVLVYGGDYNSYSPMLTILNSGNMVVAWDAGFYPDADTTRWRTLIRIQKLSPSGTPLWIQPVVITNSDSTSRMPKLVAVGADDFIICWQRRLSVKPVGLGQINYTWIYAQRFNSAGHQVWPDTAKICAFTGDSAKYLPEWFEIFPLKDEHHGIYVSWFDDRERTDYWNIYVQHVDSSGNLKWPLNGIPVSPINFGYDRVEPRMAYDPVSQDVYVIWDEDHPSGGFSQFGLVGQRIGPDGSLKWGNLGKIILDYTMDTSWYILGAKLTPGRDIILMADRQFIEIDPPDTLLYDELFSMKLDSTGKSLWTPSRVIFAGTNGTKFYPAMTNLSNGMYVISWGENRNSPFDPVGSVYAQNVKLDGSLGPLGIDDPGVNTDNGLFIYPNPTRDQSWIIFSDPISSRVDVAIYNSAGLMIRSFSRIPDPDTKSLVIDCGDLSSGIYFIRVNTNRRTEFLKWVVL